MTTLIEKERTDTAVKERPIVPLPLAPKPRQRRPWFAWIASLVVIAAVGVVTAVMLSSETETAVDLGSGESMYATYDWYADLEGFYLPPAALAPSGESAYMEYEWYADLGGYYLPEPYGDSTPDSHYSWLVERGIIPEAHEAAPGFWSGVAATPSFDWYGERGDHRVVSEPASSPPDWYGERGDHRVG